MITSRRKKYSNGRWRSITKANGSVDWSAARVTDFLSVLQFDRGDYSGAERYARQALEMAHTLGGEENPQAASALIDLANAESFQGNPASAEPLLRQAVAIRKKENSDRTSDCDCR